MIEVVGMVGSMIVCGVLLFVVFVVCCVKWYDENNLVIGFIAILTLISMIVFFVSAVDYSVKNQIVREAEVRQLGSYVAQENGVTIWTWK